MKILSWFQLTLVDDMTKATIYSSEKIARKRLDGVGFWLKPERISINQNNLYLVKITCKVLSEVVVP